MIAPEIRADIGPLLDELAGRGYQVVASKYDAQVFGNWVVELIGPTTFDMCKDRSQFMVYADNRVVELAVRQGAFHDRTEFVRLVLAWAAG